MPFSRSFVRSGWTAWHLSIGIAMLLIGFAVTYEAWWDIWRIALYDKESGYLLLVPLASAWLVWVRRKRLPLVRPVGSLLGPACVAGGWALFAWGEPGATTLAWHGGALLVVVGCLLAVAGRDILQRFGPALAVLIFLVPLPVTLREQLVAPLHRAMAELTWTVYHALGVGGADRHGLLRDGGMNMAIAQACSGVQTVLALALVSYAFAFGKPLRASVRALILVFTPLTAVVCSVVGLIVTTWLLGQSPNEQALMLEVSRWIILGAAVLVLVGILRLLTWASVPVRPYSLAAHH